MHPLTIQSGQDGQSPPNGLAAAGPAFDLVIFDLDGTLISAPRGGGRHVRVPGSGETLAVLRDSGARLALASLCGRGFLADGMERLGLSAEVDAGRCLDSPGCSDKAMMVADLLLEFDTRSAVVIGDTRGDGAAAWANGLPFVHFVGTGADPASVPGSDATIDRLVDLPRVLDRRPRRLRELWIELDRPSGLALVGPAGSGAGLVARDLARALAAVGVAATTAPRQALGGEADEVAERRVLEDLLEIDALVITHGPAAADGWPSDCLEAVLEATAPQALREVRVRSAVLGGAAGQEAALERSSLEAEHVARVLAASPPIRRLGTGSPLDLPDRR
ncbi:Phosphoglycolate phosphatase [Planctomycetes bacterium Pla133]|uniref:phosphoglycolate phosphatase n=1 Tax=Engelhardtia mirabilis TaxID=2528011 RepID=A0A518BPP6_9BACT|nr:Phosphoglycolate phosphatase [Planctomycetes bacterium Pla133]